jgi:Heat induced stress protein YflT domain
MSTSQPLTRRTVSSVGRYEDAEHAVDYLADHDFPVDHVSIVGTGLRYVEQVTGHLTTGRAALSGGGYGALFGVFWGVLFGSLFTTDDATFLGVLAFSILVGIVFGGLVGAISHVFDDGRRDFASTSETRADHYEVQVEDGYASEAQRLLTTMPGA